MLCYYLACSSNACSVITAEIPSWPCPLRIFSCSCFTYYLENSWCQGPSLLQFKDEAAEYINQRWSGRKRKGNIENMQRLDDFLIHLWLIEGLLLSEGWAHSNEAVFDIESCLTMAHSSELLWWPAHHKQSIVSNSPARLRAMDRV